MSVSTSDRVALIGVGSMGAGIALACASGGHHVQCLVRSDESRQRLLDKVDTAFDILVSLDMVDQECKDDIRARIHTFEKISDAVEGAGLVIETVPEDIALKQDILEQISKHCASDVLITTNTSSLSLDALAKAIDSPARFAGLHWFYPAELVEIVEIVASSATTPETLAQLATFAAGIGKTIVTVKRPLPGFVVNRLQYALLREAHHLLAEGACEAEDIDTALECCLGPRWSATGPLESMDLAGLDIHLAVAQQLYPELSTAQKAHTRLVSLVEENHLGAKSGSGLRGNYDTEKIGQLLKHRASTVKALRSAARSLEQSDVLVKASSKIR